MKKKFKVIGLFLLAFLIPLTLMVIIYATRGIYPFGNKTLLTVDMAGQYVAFFNSFRNMLHGSIDIFYSFSKTLGGNMFGLITYYLLSPFNLIIYFFNKFNITEAIFLINILKIGACGLTSFIYFRKTFKDKSFMPIIFSTVYALTAYNIVYSQNLLWLDGVLLLPIVFLGIDKMIEEKKPLLYYISLVITIISNYYIGYMICIASLSYFLYKNYLHNGHNFSFKKTKKDLLYFLKYSILAALTTAVILIPSIYSLLAGKAMFTPNEFIPKQTYPIIELISRIFIGSFKAIDLEGGCPNIFISIFMIILVVVYFFNNHISKEERKASLFLVLFFIISFIFYPVDIVWHLFQHPAGFSFRYSFVFDFILLILAYKSYKNINHTDKDLFKKIIPIFIGLTLIMDKLMFTDKLDYKIILTGIIGVIYLLYLYNSDKRKITKTIGFMITLEMVINGIMVVQSLSYQSKSTYLNFLGTYGSVIDEIKENDNSIYRIEKEYSYSTNDSILLDYKGISHFSSTYEGDNNDLLGDYLGIFNRFYITNYKGSTPVTNSLFNIKYLLLNKENTLYKYVNKSDSPDKNKMIYVYENNYNLPLGFVVDNSLLNLKLSELEPFVNQNNIINEMANKNSNIFFENFISNVSYTNLELKEGSSEPYIYNKVNLKDSASINYTVKVKKAGNVYIYLASKSSRKVNIFVNGESVIKTSDQNDFRYNIIDIGKYNYNDTIKVEVELLEDDIRFNRFMAYTLDEAKFKNQINIINKNNSLNITEFSDSNIKGTVEVTGENKMLYTSIPYDKGWSVYVDNKEVQKEKVLTTLIGVKLDEGEHEIEFKYTPQGLKTGIIISIISLLTSAILIIIKK